MIFQRPAFIILYVALFIFFLFAVYAVYLYFNQSRYVYYPTSDIVATPSEVGLYYEDLTLEGLRIIFERNNPTVQSKRRRGLKESR